MTVTLPEGWIMESLEALLVSKRDLTYGIVQPGADTPVGVPIVRVKDVRGGTVDTKDPLRVAAAVEEKYERSRLRGGELLVTLVGTVGETAVAGPELIGWNVARAIAVARISPDIGARWITWVLQLATSTSLIAERLNTTVQATLNLADLRELQVPIPPPGEMASIAETLAAFDDKIESNRRQQAAAQDLLRALVDDAFRRSAGKLGVLGGYCELVKDGVATDQIDPNENYIGFDSMPRGRIFLDDWQTADGLGSNKSRFRQGDVLFGKLRPYFKKVGIAPIGGICSTDILVLRARRASDTALVAIIASSDELIDRLSAAATGTRMPRASWNDLAVWPLPDLLPDEREALGGATQPIVERMTRLTHETKRLVALRDALLPELLTGRLRALEEGVA